MTSGPRYTAQCHIGERCELGCFLCHARGLTTSETELERLLARRIDTLVFRGAAPPARRERAYRAARDSGVRVLTERTHALEYQAPEAAKRLVALGATGVRIPIFSHHPKVHDRLTERPGSLSGTLAGMRSLAAAGLAVELEVPLLSPRLQDLVALLELAHRAVPTLAKVDFELPRFEVPEPLVVPVWSEYAPHLSRALVLADALGIETTLRAPNAVPFCALHSFPEHFSRFRFAPRRARERLPGTLIPDACATCAAKRQCPGVAQSYFAAHGTTGLVPFASRPKALYTQRTTPPRQWTEQERQAARESTSLVLRPTINCNQDCTFCSANETSGNIWSERVQMFKAIARAGQRGVEWLSLSGGEPTLSKDLSAYIRVARRSGIRVVELVTNGVLLDTPKRVRPLVDAGLTQAFVSLHAHSEELSRHMTQKLGDWERTVRGVENLLDHGVRVRLNHVITARNFRFLSHYVRFVHERFGGRASISFAFVTPQYKALENIDVVPRMSDAMAYLRPALHQALELGQRFVIGSRQGIPPCLLQEFQAWSDILVVAHEALSADAPQKERAPACVDCRYANVCTGLWKPYVQRYGLDELRPLPGQALRPNDPTATSPDRMRTFADAADAQRDLVAEAEGRALYEREKGTPPAPEPQPLLPLFAPHRSRPLRVALLGTGNQARRLAMAARRVDGLSIDALASPHAPDADLSDFDPCPVYRDAVEAMDDIRPEAVIVAAATHAHFELVQAALVRRIPVLVEKPLTETEEEALELIRLRNEWHGKLIAGHNVLHASGIDEVLGPSPIERLHYERRCPPSASDAPRTWRPGSLREVLYHAFVFVGRACRSASLELESTRFDGSSRPTTLFFRLRGDAFEATVLFDFASSTDSLFISTSGRGSERAWRREGRQTTLAVDGHERVVERAGNDTERMLRQFRDIVLGSATQEAPSAEEGLWVMRTVRQLLESLERAGAPFIRPNAPKHVASRALASGKR